MGEQAQELTEALASEAEITEQADAIRQNYDGDLGRGLFDLLYPLLCKPIPSAFIQTVGNVTGKPYVSTGIRSVQVQIDRMNNVLGPYWWGYDEEFEDGGKVAKVTVYVGDPDRPLVKRSSRGGVDRGSSTGNEYKGSFTNAAKLAFARVGPGHEVYIGAADLDPDVNESVAGQVGGGALNQSAAKALADRAFRVSDAKDALQMAASHVAETEIGDCSTVEKASKALTGLTFEQAEKLDTWIKRKETEAGVDGTALAPERVEMLVKGCELAEPTLEQGGVNALDGLNVLLGSLGIDGFDPMVPLRESLAKLAPEQADALDAELQKLVEAQDGEKSSPEADAEREGGEADAD